MELTEIQSRNLKPLGDRAGRLESRYLCGDPAVTAGDVCRAREAFAAALLTVLAANEEIAR